VKALPDFLSLEDVLEIHQMQLERYGGSDGIRSMPLLESAIAMPEATFDGQFLHHDLFEMAAAYAYHIAENQPFIDGNKRTGLACALVFLEINGIEINDSEGKLYQAMIDIANKKIDKKDFAEIVKKL
jgi:death on curing protein